MQRTLERIRVKYVALSPVMDERVRRHWAATEAMASAGVASRLWLSQLGWPVTPSPLACTSRSAQQTVHVSIDVRLRRPGGGRKPIAETDPLLLRAVEELVDPATRGHPESPLRWTCKSTAKLAEQLAQENHPVTDRTVARLLKQAGYSLQANRKTREGSSHPDRNAQFEYINKQVSAFQRRNQPVISVDTKKKELVGELRIQARSGNLKANLRQSTFTTFPTRTWGRPFPMVCTI